ncbi:hypothetical protein CLHUN_34100 [Ruminiclostridium hungatei]|uniref:PepSY domain-containing protein n=1 Tax=Ruminiclostridium hungatei TaxID=48256 RepID=A0A1V4SFW3_RUMHU|nr:hypothetical protein [Ruminiclostridium hungatei]OPX42758.1 hypothetical protein CLHUN_34100 [Ruminiclostridium hungatei]
MKRRIIIALTVVISVTAISLTTFAINDTVRSHPNNGAKYNENPAPVYTDNSVKPDKNFVSEEKCEESIVKTKTSYKKSSELKQWSKHLKDENKDIVDHQISDNRMVRVIKTIYPDGLDTKAGFYANAIVTTVFDAETGTLLESTVTGDYQGKK